MTENFTNWSLTFRVVNVFSWWLLNCKHSLSLQVENILAKYGLLATTKAVSGGAKVENDQPLLELIHQSRFEDLVSSKETGMVEFLVCLTHIIRYLRPGML